MLEFVEIGRRYNCDLVGFHQMLNWGTFSPSEFAARAVQLPSHPEHVAFIEMLSDPRLADPIVYLSNLSEIRRQASRSGAKVGTNVFA
jgi:hypothetical protein